MKSCVANVCAASLYVASVYAALGLALAIVPSLALAQSCPGPLKNAKRLVLVTAETMDSTQASAQWFERAGDKWRALGAAEPALVGRSGMAWARAFRQFAKSGEPIKVEGDKRAPAGIYPITGTFGTVPSSRPGHLQVNSDTVCVDDPSSQAYNTITSKAAVAPNVHVEQMGKALPMYRRGLLLDYPTDIAAKAGSCIFVHVWRAPNKGTAGCVSMPEERVLALQDFTANGDAALAILPRHALTRLKGCLPQTVTAAR